MSKRFVTTVCLAILALPSFSTMGRTEGYFGVQPDLVQQVYEAQEDLKQGQNMNAIARANLVLIDHTLTVHVSYDAVGNRQRKDCEKAVDAAIEMWNKSLDSDHQFVRTQAEQSADIKITFKPEVYENQVPVGGLVSWRRAIAYDEGQPVDNTTAEVQVRVRRPGGGNMTFEHMRHETGHELGHVLGLDDSAHRGDLMGPLDLRRPVANVSEYELESLKRLRRAAHEVKDEALLAYAAL